MADEPRNEAPEEMSDEEMEDVVGGTTHPGESGPQPIDPPGGSPGDRAGH